MAGSLRGGLVFFTVGVLALSVGGDPRAQEQSQVWDCTERTGVTGQFGLAVERFRMQIFADGRAVGAGVAEGGGVPERFEFQGRIAYDEDLMVYVQGQRLGAVTGRGTFEFQTQIVNETTLHLKVDDPKFGYWSDCTKVR